MPKLTPRQSRSLSSTLAAVAVVAFFVFIAPFVYPKRPSPAPISAWRAESIERLSTAVSPSEFRTTCSTMLFLADGSWIAIHYRDSHANEMASLSVAVDSDGEWHESRVHYCGLFSGYNFHREVIDAMRQARENPANAGRQEWIDDVVRSEDQLADLNYKDLMGIESASDLASARQTLQKMGFAPVGELAKPKLRGKVRDPATFRAQWLIAQAAAKTK